MSRRDYWAIHARKRDTVRIYTYWYDDQFNNRSDYLSMKDSMTMHKNRKKERGRWRKDPSYMTNNTPSLDEVVKYRVYVDRQFDPDGYTVKRKLRNIRTMKHIIHGVHMKALPGPPHWDGDEGGCLGLPTDVAKLILKWV